MKLRYFAGLTAAEAAQVLGISPSTADRYWADAKVWLHGVLTDGSDDRPGPPEAQTIVT